MIKFICFVVFAFHFLAPLALLVSVLARQRGHSIKYWTNWLKKILKIKYHFLPDSNKINSTRTLILINHSTQADFFTHDIMTESTCNALSRYMVAVVFPIFLVGSWIEKTVWFFKRGNKHDSLDKFFNWVDYKFDHAIRPNLIVYPEGHRMSDASKPGPLKKGMIQYAYLRKVPVQIAIQINTHLVFNEKKFLVNFKGTDLYCYVDKVIQPSDFGTFEEFLSEVSNRFNSNFTKVMEAASSKKLN